MRHVVAGVRSGGARLDRPRKPRFLDWREQLASAEAAFSGNGFLMLVGDRQIEDLDEEIVVTPGVSVSLAADTKITDPTVVRQIGARS